MNRKISDEDTIAAISTPLGEGGIGVVRLSGKDAVAVADSLFESSTKKRVADQKTFTVQHGHVVLKNGAHLKETVDESLLLLMRAPKSYTCEDVVEISAHGGSAVLRKILELAVQAGARLALPGEFTKRAFLNGRIDLLQAEAVLDLIQAKTEQSRRWAASQLGGSLSRNMQGMKDELVGILSHLEAAVDFPDDFPETESIPEIKKKFHKLENEVKAMLNSSELGLLAKRGLKVVILGRPNVGKSSLMNCLIKANRVIVTPYPGTTRDVVEEEMQIGGFPVRILDTAGIQDTEHPIEKEGIERSRKAILSADLILFVVDGSKVLGEADKKLLEETESSQKILVVNKVDLPKKFDPEILQAIANKDVPVVESSCVTGNGVEALEKEILRFILGGRAQVPDETVVSSVRQKDLLEKMLLSLQNASEACTKNLSPEFIAVDVRLTLDHLGVLVGEVVTDDVLDVIFERFCIGK